MIYQNAETMRLTYNCLSLSATDAVTPLGLLQSKVTYANGNYSIVDLATGIVSYKSLYRKQPGYNKRNDDPKSYIYTPIYFDDPDNTDSNEVIYRQARVHILNTCLSSYHSNLFYVALQRAAIQDNCDLSEVKIDIHHIDCNRHNNAIYNLLPVTDKEHDKIHYALRYGGTSIYDALVAGLGINMVLGIFGADYFNQGDSSVYTSKIHGESYINRMLTQISAANLSSDCMSLRVKCLNEKYRSIDIANLNIYEVLSALYNTRATQIVVPNQIKTA